MCASVMAGGDAAPVFDPAEEIFDLVALSVELLVVEILDLPVLARRDTGGDALVVACGTEPVAVVAFVAEQNLGARQDWKQQGSVFLVAHLAFGEQQNDRPAQPIADSMELGARPVHCAPDTSGKTPPFFRCLVPEFDGALSMQEWKEVLCPGSSRERQHDSGNPSSNKRAAVFERIEEAGTTLSLLRPCKTDFYPIEKAFSRLKAVLRKIEGRTGSGRWDLIGRLVDNLQPVECVNCFNHAAMNRTDRKIP